jgi:glutamyl-tRNA synthetase/glutamyl-Q tRNA(Asp) synthetase
MVVSRFAPAPTGFLHLGHVVNAIYVWGIMKTRGGQVLLRIEDHDRQRSRLEYERAILEDLDWLGFVPDGDAVRQSERGAIYSAHLSRLLAAGLVYACGCSRKDIAAAAKPGDELRYPGTCASKQLPDEPGRGLRVRLAPSVERFEDLAHGRQAQKPFEQCGDLLVRDRDGNWTYQFVATVDDFEQRVTHVIRGDDLLSSTGRQIQLARLLGRMEPPRFLHHRLIMKTATQKLSKSDGDSGVRDLRARGWTAAQVLGRAAAAAGFIDKPVDLQAREVSGLFGGLRAGGEI